MNRAKEDMRNDRRCGFHTITARDLDRVGIQGVDDSIRERIGDTKVYISIYTDVLGPAFAPGKNATLSVVVAPTRMPSSATGTPEEGGWSSRELLSILTGLDGLSIVGRDVVEFAPVYDTNGETMTLAAAEVAYQPIDLMVAAPVKAHLVNEDTLV